MLVGTVSNNNQQTPFYYIQACYCYMRFISDILLFLLHINDLPSVVSSKVRLFADYCLIYRNIRNKEDQIALQKDLNLIENCGNIL